LDDRLRETPHTSCSSQQTRAFAAGWFGVGFDAVKMADSPYTIVVNSTNVWEQKIGTCGSEAEHCPGDQLDSSLTIVSNSVVGGVRTVVATRPWMGMLIPFL